LDDAKYPHVGRWQTHINGFPLFDRYRWPAPHEDGDSKAPLCYARFDTLTGRGLYFIDRDTAHAQHVARHGATSADACAIHHQSNSHHITYFGSSQKNRIASKQQTSHHDRGTGYPPSKGSVSSRRDIDNDVKHIPVVAVNQPNGAFETKTETAPGAASEPTAGLAATTETAAEFDPFADDIPSDTAALATAINRHTKKEEKKKKVDKSLVVLDISPWGEETNMEELEKAVRNIQTDGLSWKASELKLVVCTIRKLQILCVIEDEKVQQDNLVDAIEALADFVQSCTVVSRNRCG